MAVPAESTLGQEIGGYRLMRLLGRGAHGAVYLAHGSSAQPVALKILSVPAGHTLAHAGQAFLDTAAAAQSLQHPDIVKVLGAGVDQSWCWLAMEAVPGADLSRYCSAPRLLPEPLVLEIGQRLARALAHAHRLGVVHRDLKPANVLVDWPTKTVKLTDFGLARLADSANTATGLMLGSPAYMAPEQLAGNAATPQSDFYALGITLVELLTGQPAFSAQSMGALLAQVTSGPPPVLKTLHGQLPASLVALLSQLLDRSPQHRPGDGDKVADTLTQCAAQIMACRPPLPTDQNRL